MRRVKGAEEKILIKKKMRSGMKPTCYSICSSSISTNLEHSSLNFF